MNTYKEVDGEILPAYTGVNQPIYAHGAARDTEMPHDSYQEVSAPDATATASSPGGAVVENTRPEVPQEVRDITAARRAEQAKKRENDLLERFLDLQRQRYK